VDDHVDREFHIKLHDGVFVEGMWSTERNLDVVVRGEALGDEGAITEWDA